MNQFNQLSRYGAIARELPFSFGNVFFVLDPAQSYLADVLQAYPVDGNGFVRVFTTLESAYAAAVSGRNDYIFLDANSTHDLTAGLAFSKSRVNVVGIGSPRLVQQGAKIQLSGNVADAYVMKNTGTRNSFKNIKFIQSSTNAAALNVVQFAGEGNYYEDCSFIFGVADNLDLTTSAEALMGEDSGTFVRCSFGTDVLLTSAARTVMSLDAISGASSADGAKSNRFIDCEYLIMSSDANATLIKLADTAGAKFLNEWVNPRFMAVVSSGGGGIAITNAIASASGFVDGSLHFVRPTTNSCTNGCAGVTDHVTIAGAPVFSSNAWEGGTPA